jgi:hypothetical protein
MTDPAPQRARLQLEEQLRQLGELRNASTRDPGFREWRQSTLTLIQRLWPSQEIRAERFRRVPFTSPSSRMSPTVTRSFYERGCAEAAGYLKSLIGELEGDATPDTAAQAADAAMSEEGADPAAEALASPAEPFETLAPPAVAPTAPPLGELALPARAASAGPAPLPSPIADFEVPPGFEDVRDAFPLRPRDVDEPRPGPRGGLKEMLGFGEAEPSETPGPPPVPRTRPEGDSGLSAPPAGPVWHDFQSALRAEIEFSPEPAAAADEPSAPSLPIARAAAPLTPSEAEIAPTDVPCPAAPAPGPASRATRSGARSTAKRSEPKAEAADEGPSRLRKLATKPAAEEQPAAIAEAAPVEEPKSPETTAEFLDSSPVLRAQPKPVQRTRPSHGAISSPIATTLAAMAAEIERFDVPEGQRAGARALLLDLARRVDDNRLGWEDMRHAMSFVMDCPPLARRVVPLLLPFFDKTA